jgi:hypothetical protein
VQRSRRLLFNELRAAAVTIESIIDHKRPNVHMSLKGSSDSSTLPLTVCIDA